MKLGLLLVSMMSTVAAAEPLKVELAPATLTWKQRQPVKVTVKVTNTSASKVTLRVMSCSWDDQFVSSHPELQWNAWGCDKNALGSYELGPAKSREWSAEMIATAKPGSYPLALTLKQAAGDTKSNTVTITVTK
jgi:hypothetical protein